MAKSCAPIETRYGPNHEINTKYSCPTSIPPEVMFDTAYYKKIWACGGAKLRATGDGGGDMRLEAFVPIDGSWKKSGWERGVGLLLLLID